MFLLTFFSPGLASSLISSSMSVVALNNELRQLEILEKEEIEKVLATLSNMTAEELGTINHHLYKRLLVLLYPAV